MIAVIVKFELKDEVKKQLADIDVAKKHRGNTYLLGRQVPRCGAGQWVRCRGRGHCGSRSTTH